MAKEKSSGPLNYLIKILSGPVLFIIVQLIPIEGLDPKGHIALSCFVWILAWWITQPIPWSVSGLLPLLILPIAGAMPFREVIALYGQRILPFLMGVMLFGHAFQKHGLAQRMALNILRIPGMASSGSRIIFVTLGITAIISAVIDDAAAVAIMMPIAIPIAKHAADAFKKPLEGEKSGSGAPKFMAAAALGVLYGAAAGGLATPAGVPFNPLAIANLEKLTSYQVSFAQWTSTGIVLMIITAILFYFVLKVMLPSELKTIKDASKHFNEEKKKLGKMNPGEIHVLVVFIIMIILWFLPAFPAITSRFKFLDIWIVPVFATLVLFLLPVDIKKKEMTLMAKDLQTGVAWNVLFLVVSGTAIAGALQALGLTDWLGNLLSKVMTTGALPWITGLATTVIGHLTSGTATTSMLTTIIFPISETLGYNSAILARIIAGCAFAVSFPWAGAAPGTAFSSGEIKMGDMVRVGLVATVFFVLAIIIGSMIFVPLFGGAAFTFVG